MQEEVHGLKQALAEIARSLPNRHCCKRTVIGSALQYVTTPEDVEVVTRFAQLPSRCWGVDRRREYWQVLLEHFTPEEILELYMAQCPRVVTRKQYVALQRLLVSRLQLSEDCVRQAMMWLTVRVTPSRRKLKHHHYFVAGCSMEH